MSVIYRTFGAVDVVIAAVEYNAEKVLDATGDTFHDFAVRAIPVTVILAIVLLWYICRLVTLRVYDSIKDRMMRFGETPEAILAGALEDCRPGPSRTLPGGISSIPLPGVDRRWALLTAREKHGRCVQTCE